MNPVLGVSMILLFCLSQAFRDVYLGHIFQNVDFFAVILLAFIPSTIAFAAIAFFCNRDDLAKLRGQGATLLGMNVATALAWTSYFFGLTHVDPSVVNTLHSGVAPLTVIALAALGLSIAGAHRVVRLEGWLLGGMAATLVGLWWVVLSGRSGVEHEATGAVALALFLLVVSGASITISHLLSRRLHDAGLNATTITASRYILICIVAALFLAGRDAPTGITTLGQGAIIGAAAALLIALPLYALQVGLGHTPQLMAHILRALGPVFVFALEQFDGRLSYSAPVLALILAYSLFVAGANIAHSRAARAQAA